MELGEVGHHREVEGYPSGQRGQTVNLLATPTEVRILPPPPSFARKRAGNLMPPGYGRQAGSSEGCPTSPEENVPGSWAKSGNP